MLTRLTACIVMNPLSALPVMTTESSIRMLCSFGTTPLQKIDIHSTYKAGRSHLSNEVCLLHNAAVVPAPLCEEAPQLLDGPCAVVHLLCLWRR